MVQCESKKLAENFYLYEFPSDEKNSLGKNIFVILEHHQALLIDAGYEEDARLILDDLTQEGYSSNESDPFTLSPGPC